MAINDCSKDDTENVVRSKGYDVISLCCNLGYSGAILTGLKYASEKNYDYVIQFDGDGQHDPNDIKKLIKELYLPKFAVIK
ncbi:glycosyltransferase [Paenibacillus dendritiformis]|uniref:glycosyltransferase n=1 Tax=Paenibacillus dendritiformis TaxID=130049 RepID=UPI0018CF23D8|nr:glycosyltransferase [Paenibacillus dendritiformis]